MQYYIMLCMKIVGYDGFYTFEADINNDDDETVAVAVM